MDKVKKLIEMAKEDGNKLLISRILSEDLTDDESDELFKLLSENNIVVLNSEIENQNDEENSKTNYHNKDLYEQYMSEVNKIPLLNVEEEIELGYKLRSSDAKIVAFARKKLIESNLRLAAAIARDIFWKTKPNRLDILDLTQEANIGLQKAVDKYDVTLGFKLSTYATWWIRQTITRALSEQSRTIRVPVHANESISKMNYIRRQFLSKYGREAKDEELAELMETTIENIIILKRADQEILSLESPIGEEEDSQLSDFIPSEYDTETEAQQKIEFAEVQRLMKKILTPREIYVISQRYGIGLEGGLTLEEVGNQLNLTRERVRQIESKALRKLKYYYYRQSTNNPQSYSEFVLRKTKFDSEDD